MDAAETAILFEEEQKKLAAEANKGHSAAMKDSGDKLDSAKKAQNALKRLAEESGDPLPQPPTKLLRLLEDKEAANQHPRGGRGGRGGRGRGGRWPRGAPRARGGRGKYVMNFF